MDTIINRGGIFPISKMIVYSTFQTVFQNGAVCIYHAK